MKAILLLQRRGNPKILPKKNQRRPRTQKKPPYALNFVHRSNGDNHEKASKTLIDTTV
jgi:hypothetical protein